MFENSVAAEIIGAAIEVHKVLGPGLLESAYHECLMLELVQRCMVCESEVPIVVNYKGHVLENAYRADLLVSHAVIVEVKTVEQVRPVHKAQLLTYLRLTGKRLGLLLNFYVPVMKNGIYRIANQL
jgi:GxxExxY protein